MFLAFATLYPETQVLLFFVIPIKVKWLALLDALYFVLIFLRYPFPMNLLPIIALVNYYIFCGSELIRLLQPLKYRVQRNMKSSRPSSGQTKKSGPRLPYSHKCSTCGRTDAENPNLEFRYCSRCAGYHCFCEDHINNHVHFKE